MLPSSSLQPYTWYICNNVKYIVVSNPILNGGGTFNICSFDVLFLYITTIISDIHTRKASFLKMTSCLWSLLKMSCLWSLLKMTSCLWFLQRNVNLFSSYILLFFLQRHHKSLGSRHSLKTASCLRIACLLITTTVYMIHMQKCKLYRSFKSDIKW